MLAVGLQTFAMNEMGVLFAANSQSKDSPDVFIAVAAVVIAFGGILALIALLENKASGTLPPAIPAEGASKLVTIIPWTEQQQSLGNDGIPSLPPELASLGPVLSFHKRPYWNPNSIMSGQGSPAPSDHVVFQSALVTLHGDLCAVFPWEAIECSVGCPFDLRWQLRTVDGVDFVVSIGGGGGDLYETICHKLFEIQAPRMLHRMDRGEIVPFGEKIAMSRNGLVKKGETLSWRDMTSIKLVSSQMGRHLHVSGRGMILPWARISLNDMPNDRIFLELAKQLCPPRLLASTH
ncbi:MAG: DUF6585 family protein [Fimbriiglobus sp.]